MATPYYDIVVDVIESYMETDPLWIPTEFTVRVPGPAFEYMLKELVVEGTKNKLPETTKSFLLRVCGLDVTIEPDDEKIDEEIQ